MPNPNKNCICCFQQYEPYKIGKASELYGSDKGVQSIVPVLNEDGTVKEPQGLCPFCNPKSTIWFTPKMKCHYEH